MPVGVLGPAQLDRAAHRRHVHRCGAYRDPRPLESDAESARARRAGGMQLGGMLAAVRQPAILRKNTSMTNAVNAIPDQVGRR